MVNRPGMNQRLEDHLASMAHINPVIAMFVDWPGDPSHSHTGVGFLRWSGYVFSGIGPMGGIRIPSEQEGIIPATAQLELVGIPDAMTQNVARQDARGSKVRMWVGFVTERGGNTLIGGTNLVDLFTGYVVKQTLRMQRVSPDRIEQSLLLDIGTGPRGRATASVTHSDEDQRRKYPGDTAGRHTIYSEKNIKREFWVP